MTISRASLDTFHDTATAQRANAEKDRVASISVWDGTVTASGQAVDFTSADFIRIKDGLVAQNRDTVDYAAMYQSFSLLAEPSGPAHPPLQHPQSTR